MSSSSRETTPLRLSTAALLVSFVVAASLELHPHLSAQSQDYQTTYPNAVRSGPDLTFGFSKLLLLAGMSVALVSAIAALARRRGALTGLLLSGPAIAYGLYLNAPPPDYPSVEPFVVSLAWCATSALWGATTVLAWMDSATLHSRSSAHDPNKG